MPTPTIAGWPLSREMSGLDLGKKSAYHCADCAHVAGSLPLAIGIATAMAALALIVGLWLNLLASLILVFAGVALVGWNYVPAKRRALKRQGLPLPVLPKVEELKLTEELRGRITLKLDGSYPFTLDPVEGRLTAVLELGKLDRQRLKRYLRKHRIERNSDVRFSAGSLVLHGKAGINLSGSFPSLVIPLSGTTSGYPVFNLDRHRASSPYRADHTYLLMADRDVTELPVWITPAIVPRSDRRALEIQVQWADIGPPGSHLGLQKVKSLELWVPAIWGDIEAVTGAAVMRDEIRDEQDRILRPIEWLWLRPSERERRDRRLDLVVQFGGQAARIDSLDIIQGRIDAVFTGALSGIKGVSFFGPLGDRRGSPGDVTTHVVLDFDLSLAKTRYEDIRLIPDRSVPEDHEKDELDEFPAVIPNDETVISLTNAISDAGYYIKRVIENPPRSGARANQIQRYWDIAGRRYGGVYPMDFHIVLTGEEVYHGGIHAHSGSTNTRITVQGSYANPDMRLQVEHSWMRLHELTKQALKPPLAASLPDDWLGTANGQAAGSENGAGPATPRSSARLLALLGLLDEALLHGRISDTRYWEMRKRAEQRLGG